MMNNPLISIIIPAYNVASYLERCLDSLLNQTYPMLEIIVVDDGSKDNTGAIADAVAQNDSRIVVIHKENGGVSSARIVGINVATGDYIGFVDGDDCVESGMFEKLLDNAIKYDADISHCGYQMIFPDGHIDYYYNTGRKEVHNRVQGVGNLIEGKFVEPGIWNKLYRRELVVGVDKDAMWDSNIRNNEDLLMNYILFSKAEKSVYEDIPFYHYVLRKGSAATSKLNEHKLKDPVRVMRIILEDSNKMPEIFAVAQQRYITQLIGISTLPIAGQKELVKPFRREIRQELRKSLCTVLTQPRIRKSVKLRAVWASVWPTSYQWAHHFYAVVTGLDRKYRIE